MNSTSIIRTERDAKAVKAQAEELASALSAEATFDALVKGLPVTVGEAVRDALREQKKELDELIEAYELAKGGDAYALEQRAGNNAGLVLIVARIKNGLTQKELARRLGLKEQQIQRYEAEYYSRINLSNYQRIASVLGVQMRFEYSDWIKSGWSVAEDITATNVKKVLRHARANGWFDDEAQGSASDEASFNYLQRYISDHIGKLGSPSLLRTGLNVQDLSDDLSLIAWRARVTRRAEQVIEASKPLYKPMDISWLAELPRLSTLDDGPIRAQKLLREKGILLLAEPQISGMKVDGAAFLVDQVPVIALTLLHDRIDNFWFTLLHEVAHVVLHYRSGLSIGFFDDTSAPSIDELEKQADEFASNLLIPNDVWHRSPARISKSPAVIEKFARRQDIHPAIVFGRIQKERNDFRTFSNKLGRGRVRPLLLNDNKERNDA